MSSDFFRVHDCLYNLQVYTLSTKRDVDIDQVLKKLKFVKNFDTWNQVAEYLDVDKGTLSAWRRRNTQSAIDKIVNKCHGDVNRDQLLGNNATVTGTNNTTISTTNHRGDVVTNQPTANHAQEKTVQLSDQEAELIRLMREYMSPAERRALLDDLREKEERYR